MIDLERIDLVDRPAIMETWVLLNEVQMGFTASTDEQRIVTGPVFIPDLPIKRFQPLEEGGQPMYFYVIADKETVRDTAKMYSRSNKLNSIGLMHTEALPDGVHMFQSFISDKESGITPKGYENLPDGTWFMSFLVDDDNIWQAAKEGKLNGFSLQSKWGFKEYDEEAELASALNSLESALEKIANKIGVAIQ